MVELFDAVQLIADVRTRIAPVRPVLVGVSGIDGSGKGHWSARLRTALLAKGLRSEVVSVDMWLALPSRRFDASRPAWNFYEHGIRFDAMLNDVVRPLGSTRSLRRTIDAADATMTEQYNHHTLILDDLDVLIVEGIFLFKRQLRDEFDVRIWIDCTFETALERALRRGQEGLPEREVIRDYHTVYFPAQQLHAELDDPTACADLVVVNDERLGLVTEAKA